MASRWRLAFPFVLLSGIARAVCPIFPAHYSVGPDGVSCSYPTIQAAIDAVGSCPVVVDITSTPGHLYGGGGFCTDNQSAGCHLHVSGKNVTLQGWGAGVSCYDLNHTVCDTCGPGTTAPLVTLDGAGAGGSVLSITAGASPTYVTVRNLVLTHGATAFDGSGGGVAFAGAGSLIVENSTLSNNYAGYGGAINVSAGGGGASLRLLANTQLINNTAQYSGGGIRIEGPARLFALQDYTVIEFNHALGHDPVSDSASGGYGGGIEILGPARADLGSPGYNTAGIVSNNDAVYGAGIAVIDNGNGEAVLRTFADAAQRPTVIEDNGGATQGGALYLSGLADACLFATRLAGNVAANGSAIWYNNDGDYPDALDKGVFVNGGWPNRLGDDCGPEFVADLGGSTACAAYDARCNAIVGNQTKLADGTPAPGATIRLRDTTGNGGMTALRLRLQDNTAGTLVDADRPFQKLDLHRCLITDNTVSGALIVGGAVSAHSCTIARNTVGGTALFVLDSGSLDLLSDIIDSPSQPVFESHDEFVLNAAYLITNNSYRFPDNASILIGHADFVDAPHGDYHLIAYDQHALDFGANGDYEYEADLDGMPASVDLPLVPDYLPNEPPVDLGAYERQNMFDSCGTTDSLFCDGFGH